MIGMTLQSFSLEKINLSSTPADSSTPHIAIDPQGRILVLWCEMDWPLLGIADVLYITQENGLWSEVKETISQLYDARNPHLNAGSDGNFHLTYDDGKTDTSRDIFYRSFSFQDRYWSNIQRVCLNDLNSSNPRIAENEEGKIYVMWTQQIGQAMYTQIVMNSRGDDDMWPETFENVSRNNYSSAVYPCFGARNKDIHACWMDNRNGVWDIFYSEKIQDEWNLPTQINSSGEKYWPSLALDREGNVHVIYSTKEGNIFYIKRESGIWSSPFLISTGFRSSCVPYLKIFKNNTLHAVWIQKTVSGVSIFYGRGASSGQWLDPVQISVGNDADKPSVELDDSGNAHIVWEDTGINKKKDVFYTVITPPGIKPTAVFSTSKSSGIVPLTVYFDASGSAPGEGVIHSFCWDFGDGSEIEEGRQIFHTFEQAGNFSVKLYVTNSQLLVTSCEKEIQILSGPFPPTDIVVKKTQEGGLFYRERINAITWKENPENKGQVSISHYNIYRKFKNQENAEFKKIGQVNDMTYKYVDRDFVSPEDRDKFAYALSAVDDKGREGPLGFALYLEKELGIKTFKSRLQLRDFPLLE